jgi:hypothetical protein
VYTAPRFILIHLESIVNGSHLAIGVSATLAAVGALSRRGSSSRVDAGRWGRKSLLNQVKDEAIDLSREMFAIQASYKDMYVRTGTMRAYLDSNDMRVISEAMKSIFSDRNFISGSTRIVTRSKVDPRLVIKLNPGLDENLFEAAVYRSAGPETKACLVPVLAHSWSGSWLIMEYAELASDVVWPPGPCSRRLKALGFRDVEHRFNLTEDGRLLDYAERVRTRGSAARPRDSRL